LVCAITGWLGMLGVAACSESPTAPVSFGPLIALDSLTVADGQVLPCCAVDSAGARVTIIGGTLSFYRAATFSDTVFTPGGPMSGACVQEVANGAHLTQNGLVTLPGGDAYLLLPCSVGNYRLTVTQRVVRADGSQQTIELALSTGSYAWQRDSLTLFDAHAPRPFSASMSGPTITVTAGDHRYQLVAVPSPR
jgi:hypothetical protein